MRYAYPCSIARDEKEEQTSGREAYTATFPDVYGANTGGWSWEEAVEMAKDCLGVALGLRENAVRRLLDPGHQSPMTAVEKALEVVGRSLVVEDRAVVQYSEVPATLAP